MRRGSLARRVGALLVVLWAALALSCAGEDGAGTGGDAVDGPADATAGADAAADVAADVAAAPDVPPSPDVLALPDTAADDASAGDAAADDATEPDVPPRPTGPYVVPSGPADLTFHVGPYLGTTTTASVVVSWQTLAAGDSAVEFGLDASYGGRAEGPGETTMHEVVVDGLAPETIYHYRACTAGTCTGDLTFATAPLPGRPLRFGVHSDTQTRFETHALVAEGLRQSAPAFVLHAGDVVGYGADRDSYRTEFFDPARRRNHYVPTYAAVGNHDWKDRASNVQNFRDHFAFPVHPEVPIPETSYSFTYGDVFVIVLDNTLDGAQFFFPLGGAQEPPLWEWLVAQAESEAAHSARWRFAVFHYPPVSACQETWMPMAATRLHVLPLLEGNGFQAVFTGHTHEYQHQVHGGLHVFVTGGAGGSLDTDESCVFEVPELVYRESRHHHLTVDVGAEEAIVRAVGLDGDVFDTVPLAPASP
jgi:predicted phosphodiesterase